MLTTQSFFDLTTFLHKSLFSQDYVWESLKGLKEFMDDQVYIEIGRDVPLASPTPETLVLVDGEWSSASNFSIEFGDATKGNLQVFNNGELVEGASVVMAGTVLCGRKISLGKGVLIESGALIKEPAILGDFTEVRQGAYLRGYCLAGKRCVIGHTTEVKHSIFLDDAKAGHFAYLGDSILGNRVNLGAGTKLANLRFTGGDVPVLTPNGTLSTGLRKLGAIMADDAQTGCNSVTNPGSLLGKRSMLMPNTTSPSGYHPPNSLIRG